MMEREVEITHKELLTFSNLTNLEWEFVDLDAIKEGFILETDPSEALQLGNIIVPEVFIRRDDDGDFEKFVYMEDVEEEADKLTDEEKMQGKLKMRQKAGIAMEYLEKEDGEGSFLKDWEVIYAADNYKLVADYIKYLQKMLQIIADAEPNENIPPGRNEFEDLQESQKRIKLAFTAAEGIFGVAAEYFGLDGEVTGNLIKEVGKKFTKEVIRDLAQQTDVLPVQILGILFGNVDKLEMDVLLSFLKDSSNPVAEKLCSSLDFNPIEEIETGTISEGQEKKIREKLSDVLEEEMEIKIYQDLDMKDTGFRVLALKKENDIVIAYKAERPEGKRALPVEFDNLQIVRALLEAEHMDDETEITITGYEGGGDLGLLHSLLLKEDYFRRGHLFFHDLRKPKEYLDFTKRHLDKDYEPPIRIVVSGIGNLGTKAVKSAIYVAVAAWIKGVSAMAGLAGLKATIIGYILWQFLKVKLKLDREETLSNVYRDFHETGILTEDDDLGNNRVAREFVDGEFVELDAGDKIKVKKEHAVYILLEEREDSIGKYRGEELDEKAYEIPIFSAATSRGSSNTHEREVSWLLEKKGDCYEINRVINRHIEKSDSAGGRRTVQDSAGEKEVSEQIMDLTEIENLNLIQVSAEYTKLTEGIELSEFIEIMGKMQKNYLERKDLIEAIYYSKVNFFLEEQSELVNDTDIFTLTRTKTDEYDRMSDSISGEVAINEYVFLPYIDEEGNISEELRDEYIAQAFKSMVQYALDKKFERKTGQRPLFLVHSVKFGSEERQREYIEKYGKWSAGDNDLKDKFISMIEGINNVKRLYGTYYFICNHYWSVLEKIKEDKTILDDFYEVEDEEELEDYEDIFSDIIEKIDLLPDWNEESIEYKYNLYDALIGGEMEIYLKEVPAKKKIAGIPLDKSALFLVTAGSLGIPSSSPIKKLTEGLEKKKEMVLDDEREEEGTFSELKKLTKYD